jgi:tetratricopeptide (TPR) repeat protein
VETSNVDAYRAYLRARQAEDEGRGMEVRRDLDAAIALDSGFIAAVSERLSAAVGDNDQQTIDKLRPLVARYASRATEWDRMVQELELAYFNGEHERAEALGARLVARFPRDPRAYGRLHSIYMMHGRFDQAARIALSALALDSLGIEAGNGPCVPCTGYKTLTDARLASGDYQGALAAAKRWLALQPNVPSAWMNRAYVAVSLQQYDTALAATRRAQVLNGGGDEYWEFLVRVLLMSRRYADVDTAVAAAMNSSRRVLAFDLEALLERERGQLRASNRTVDAAVAESPSLAWLNLMKANSLGRLGQYAEGARIVEKQSHFAERVSFPMLGGGARGFAWHHALEADLLASSGDTTRLRALADSVEVGGSRSYYGRDWRLPHHIRGLIALAGHRYDEAIRELRDALWTSAGWTRTNVELARAYLGKKQPSEAVKVLRPAYGEPLDAMARYAPRSELDYWMAISLRDAGQLDSARVYAARVRESWKDADPEVKRLLADLNF